MVKTLRILLFLAALGVVGCASLSKRDFPEGHIHGVGYPTMSQSRIPYSLEEQVLYNKRYYLQEAEEKQGILPFIFYPFDKVQRVLDLDSNKITLDSAEKYLPIRVEVVTGTKDKWADEISLMARDSRLTGVKGIRANIISAEELREIANTSKNNYGYKVITTEDNASFAIKTIWINEQEYFFPHVSDTKTFEKEKLPFYLIPVKGAKILINNSCENITIRNENNIYRPVLIDKETGLPITSGQELRYGVVELYLDYRNNSIVDYLESIGQPSDLKSRTRLAQEYEIEDYRGTAEQNLQLLLLLLRQEN